MNRNSEDVFRELYQTYYGDIHRYVQQSVRDKEEVEARVQDVFLTAQRHLGKFGGEVGYKVWLFSIAHQTIGSLWRKALRRKKGSKALQAPEPEIEDNETFPDSEQVRLRRYEKLIRMLGSLTDDDRDVIVLHLIHQFSVTDTAVILHVSDSRVYTWLERAEPKLREDWEEGSDGLEQALETARYLPTDYDLSHSKAVGWEQVQLRQKRRAKLMTRWLPAAGVLTAAAVALLVWQASGNELKPGQLSGNDVPAAAADPAEEGREQGDEGKSAVEAHRDAWQLKEKLYADRGQALMMSDPEWKIDIVREGQTKLFLIKDEQQTLLLDSPDAASIDITGFSPPTILISARIRGMNDMESELYYYDIDKMEGKQIPLQGNIGFNLTVWGPEQRKIAYLSHHSDGQGQSVLSYDLDTGETTVLREAEDLGMSHLWMNGEMLMLVSPKSLEFYEDGTWHLIYKESEYDIEMHHASLDEIVFHAGVSPAGAGRSRHGYDYAGTKRAMLYDRKTRSTIELMPNVEGEQEVIVAASRSVLPQFLLTSFVPDPLPEGQEWERNRTGHLHFYEVVPGGEPQLIYSRPSTWFASQLFREYQGPEMNEMVLIPAYGGDATKLFRLRYLPREHRIEEMTQDNSGNGPASMIR